MPSTTSSWVSRLLASSTVMTPSFPTFSIASAIKSPMVRSPLADTMPTWATSALLLVDLESFFSSPTTAVTALSTPRLRLIGSWPAATSFAPSVKRARASTLAVVVPSPATSEVFEATSFTICAPMFSNLSASSISFATVTPSLVTVGGAPRLLEHHVSPARPQRHRDRIGEDVDAAQHLGPRVRAEQYQLSRHRSVLLSLSLDDAEDVLLAEDQGLLAVELDLGAGVPCRTVPGHRPSRRASGPCCPPSYRDRPHWRARRLAIHNAVIGPVSGRRRLRDSSRPPAVAPRGIRPRSVCGGRPHDSSVHSVLAYPPRLPRSHLRPPAPATTG